MVFSSCDGYRALPRKDDVEQQVVGFDAKDSFCSEGCAKNRGFMKCSFSKGPYPQLGIRILEAHSNRPSNQGGNLFHGEYLYVPYGALVSAHKSPPHVGVLL